ncbi:hypothetical protein [Ralstonia pseudosolanacearum]|uniref:hypothetical protein n=1 Tax=Ralstonia pseudosolanacearum TaxID=1310165 RepID=UPI003CF60265
MVAPSEPHILHRYRYLDKRTKRWKTTRHHMSQEKAGRFFTSREGLYPAEKMDCAPAPVARSANQPKGSGNLF